MEDKIINNIFIIVKKYLDMPNNINMQNLVNDVANYIIKEFSLENYISSIKIKEVYDDNFKSRGFFNLLGIMSVIKKYIDIHTFV